MDKDMTDECGEETLVRKVSDDASVSISQFSKTNTTVIEEDESMWSVIKSEFKWENLSLNFERNSSFLKKDPEEVLEHFHSSMVSFFFVNFINWFSSSKF
jgi:hypothetical protein